MALSGKNNIEEAPIFLYFNVLVLLCLHGAMSMGVYD